MTRSEKFEMRANRWLVVALLLVCTAFVCFAVGIHAALSFSPLVCVCAAVAVVLIASAAMRALSEARHWSLRAAGERRFETIETLSRPRWHESHE